MAKRVGRPLIAGATAEREKSSALILRSARFMRVIPRRGLYPASPESITIGRGLWIPGSPPSVAPGNDQSVHMIGFMESLYYSAIVPTDEWAKVNATSCRHRNAAAAFAHPCDSIRSKSGLELANNFAVGSPHVPSFRAYPLQNVMPCAFSRDGASAQRQSRSANFAALKYVQKP